MGRLITLAISLPTLGLSVNIAIIFFFSFMYSVPSGTEYVSNFFRLMLPVPFPG